MNSWNEDDVVVHHPSTQVTVLQFLDDSWLSFRKTSYCNFSY